MTLDEIRVYVRTIMDLDDTDLPDVVLDQFIRNGYRRIVRREPRWAFLQTTVTFATVAGVAAYPLVQLGVERVRAVNAFDTGRTLDYIGPEAADRAWSATVGSGSPCAWSQWAGELHLWPGPSGAETLTVRGYRAPTDWVSAGAGAEPDIPPDFHPVIASWAVSEGYAAQEDDELSPFWATKFADDLTELDAAWRQQPTPEPIVMGSGGRRTRRAPFSFPWE